MAPSIRETVCKHFSKIETELSIDDLRKNFSYYVQLLHDQIYEDFLVLQDKAFNKAFSEEIKLKEELSFEKFDKFFLSLSQSRRVRSGGVFEIIIEKLLNHLSYPLDIQKKIGKKKVDFVLPSIDFFQNDPLNSIFDCLSLFVSPRFFFDSTLCLCDERVGMVSLLFLGGAFKSSRKVDASLLKANFRL